MKRTKIVCTIGPASDSVATLVKLGKAGMDIARMNFSHGTHATHKKLFQNLQIAGKKLGRPFGILLDLQGPKIRVGDLPKEGITLVKGQDVVFSNAAKCMHGDIPVPVPTLHTDVKVGEKMLFDDGLMDVIVKKIQGHRIYAEVKTGGVLLSHKGLNLPGTKLRIPALSEKDRDDALFGVKLGVDYIALSFVRSPEDIVDLRKLLVKQGKKGRDIKIIAKIEKQEALDCFDKILDQVDAIMVARGDLGVETPAAGVPVAQKKMIEACRERAIPVIVATQMLDSMQRNPRPTRAEVSDVANAVQDHADAIMLSGETASGAYPVEAVTVMSDTVKSMEASAFDDLSSFKIIPPHDVLSGAAAAIRLLIDTLEKPEVVVATRMGLSAREVASTRPETVIHAVTDDARVARQLRLVWGVVPYLVSKRVLEKGFAQFVQKIKRQDAKKRESIVALSVSGDKKPCVRIEVM